MRPEHLHIVCLDAPSPPDYGGAIDMYYKAEALAAAGVRIILHYFAYRSGRDAGALASVAAEVHAYPRSGLLRSLTSGLPYIVSSRINSGLIERLNADDHPILVEGLHGAGILPQVRNGWQRAVVRMHNEEGEYYRRLANAERSWWKRRYFRREARCIQSFQNRLPKSLKLAPLSRTDAGFFQQAGFRNLSFIPCFVPWESVESGTGLGGFALYHGNLGVAENEAAARWLINEVFNRIPATPLVVAGKGISSALRAAAGGREQVRFIADPTIGELDRLVREAQLHVLPSLNATGVKLKLLHALFAGRHCITNPSGVAGSGLENEVVVCDDDPDDWCTAVQALMPHPFSGEERESRRTALGLYDNKKNAAELLRLLFE